MADLFRLLGSFEVVPFSSASGAATVKSPITEEVTLNFKAIQRVNLTADAPVAVDFCGLTNAHVVILATTGGKVSARFTSADGATQAIPVDDFFALVSRSVPITALDLTRVAGTLTTVDIFLGERT